MPTDTNYMTALENMNACEEAREWVATVPDPVQAWNTCERGDWMIWLLAGLPSDSKKLRLVTCDIAQDVLDRYWDTNLKLREDKRLQMAIDVARRYVNGEATLSELRTAREGACGARRAAYAAAYAADADADAAAAYAADAAAAYAADAAYAAADAAYAAADAADADADADAYAAYAAAVARASAYKRQAEIVRRYFTADEVLTLLA